MNFLRPNPRNRHLVNWRIPTVDIYLASMGHVDLVAGRPGCQEKESCAWSNQIEMGSCPKHFRFLDLNGRLSLVNRHMPESRTAHSSGAISAACGRDRVP